MQHRKIGFTLIELLVVVSIIAVLAGMLLAAVGKVRQSALDVVCINNQRQQFIAMTAWAQSHKGRLPGAVNGSGPKVISTLITKDGSTKPGEASVFVTEGDLPDKVFACPVTQTHRGEVATMFMSWLGIDWSYDYAAHIGFVGNAMDADGLSLVVDPGGTSIPRFPGSHPLSKTVLTCDRVYFVSYTDTWSAPDGSWRALVSSSSFHKGGRSSVAGFADGHASMVPILKPDWFPGLPSYLPGDNQYIPYE